MKKQLLVILMVLGLALVGQAQADMLVTDIDPVGSLTNADTNPQWVTPSNPATEEAWLEGLLGDVDVDYYGKDDDGTWNDGVWTEGNPSQNWTYAVLKYGVGEPDEYNPDHWAILDDGNRSVDLNLGGLPTSGLSHISYFGSLHHAPEPASLLLFGAGLIGLIGIGKKYRNS